MSMSPHTSPADAAAHQLVADYISLHDNPSTAGIAALFTPDFVVMGSTLPAEGLRGEAYLGFLRSLKGTSFTQDAGSPVELTEDKRLMLRWTLRNGDTRLAGGVDYLSVDGGRISKVVGVY